MLSGSFSALQVPYSDAAADALKNTPSLKGAYCICTQPYLNLRGGSGGDSAELSGQILFGECFRVLEASMSQVRVQRIIPGIDPEKHSSMTGWLDAHLAARCLSDEESTQALREPGHKLYLSAVREAVGYPLDRANSNHRIPLGGILPGYDPDTGIYKISEAEYYLAPICVVQKGMKPVVADFETLYNEFAGTQYLWGGGTPAGADCSGFTQTMARFFGVDLPRDSVEQAQFGEAVSLEDAMTGDLVFIKSSPNASKPINHVGFFGRDDNGQLYLFHAKQQVRCDPVSIESDGHLIGVPESPEAKLVCIKRIATFR